jgi:hypothetical protein
MARSKLLIALVAITGPSTTVMLGDDRVSVPDSRPVLMTGRAGAKAWGVPGTWHGAPDMRLKPRRLFFQIAY